MKPSILKNLSVIMKNKFLIPFLLFLFTGCEVFQVGFTTIKGQITDKVTGKTYIRYQCASL